MTEINPDAPILVTGATGYLAGVIIQQLLDKGHTVHAAVRDPSKTDKLQYLNAIADASDGSIRYFKADLTTSGAYSEGMAGCELVIHTASPFTLAVDDPQKTWLTRRWTAPPTCSPAPMKPTASNASC
nr:NAD(P)H-binding protein [Maricaulis sp.]